MPILTKIAIFTPVLVIVALVSGVSAILTLCMEPINWLPEAGDTTTFLGILLTAQATIAALTLAVTLFVMREINTRQDIDNRMYREYVRRSWVGIIFWSSIGAVAVTGSVLMSEHFVSKAIPDIDGHAGLRNLTLVAVAAFIANLALAVILLERSIFVGQPAQWRQLREDINKRDVSRAVRDFLNTR